MPPPPAVNCVPWHFGRPLRALPLLALLPACGPSELPGEWSSRELAIAVEQQPERYDFRGQVALVRPDEEALTWLPIENAQHGAWVDGGRRLFTVTHTRDRFTWRYGDEVSTEVVPIEGGHPHEWWRSPEGSHLLLVEGTEQVQGALRIVETSTMQTRGFWAGCQASMRAYQWIDDGPDYLWAATECELQGPGEPWTLLRLGPGGPQTLVELAQSPSGGRISPDGRWLVLAVADRRPIYDLQAAEPVGQLDPSIDTCAWSWRSGILACLHRGGMVLYDPAGQELGVVPDVRGHPHFSRDDRRIMAYRGDALLVYELASGETDVFETPEPPPHWFSWFHGDPRISLTAIRDGGSQKSYALDPDTAEWTALTETREDGWASSHWWSPDGSMMLKYESCAGQEQRRPVLFDVDLQRVAEGPCAELWSATWSPDSDVVAIEVHADDRGERSLLLRSDGHTRWIEGRIFGWRP